MPPAAERFARECPAVSTTDAIGTGEVLHYYHGELTDSPRTVRIFTLAPDVTDQAVFDAFERASGKWYNASTHPNIVGVQDRGTDPHPWIAVDLVDGRRLDSLHTELSLPEIRTVLCETAEALRNAALYNTVHSGLDPNTIWVCTQDSNSDKETSVTAVVDDWGLRRACRVAVGEPVPSPFTAPELRGDTEQGTEHADVYSLGAITYYVLTGQPPSSPAGGPASELTPPSSHSDHPNVTSDVDRVVLTALAENPADRYDSAYAFQTAISRVLPDPTAVTPPAPAPDPNPDTPPDEDVTDAESIGEQAEATPATDTDTDTPADTTDEDSTGEATTEDYPPGGTTRRATLGLIGLGAVASAGWYLSTTDQSPASTTDQSPASMTDQSPASTIDVGTTSSPATQTQTTTDSGPDFDPEASIEITAPFADKQYINWDDQPPEATVEYVFTANLSGSVHLVLNDHHRAEDQFDTEPGESQNEAYIKNVELPTGNPVINVYFYADGDSYTKTDQTPVRVYRPDETFEHSGISQDDHVFDVLSIATVTVPVTISLEEIPGEVTPEIKHSIVYGTSTDDQETIATHTEPGEHTVDIEVSRIKDLLGSDPERFSSYLNTAATVGGEPVAQTQTQLAFDTAKPSFSNLYEDATLESLILEKRMVEEELEGIEPHTERVAHLASMAAWKHEHGDTTEDIRREIKRFQEDGIINTNAYIDKRTTFRGVIVEGYVEEDDGAIRKFMTDDIRSETEISDLFGYYIISGEDPVDGEPDADEDLYQLWTDGHNSFVELNYHALENRVEEFGGREEIDEAEWRRAWRGWWEGFNDYLLDYHYEYDSIDHIFEEPILAPTDDAWRYIGSLESIQRGDHTDAFEDWKKVNVTAKKAQSFINSDQYLEIDYTGRELKFDIIDEYDPAEIHDF